MVIKLNLITVSQRKIMPIEAFLTFARMEWEPGTYLEEVKEWGFTFLRQEQ